MLLLLFLSVSAWAAEGSIAFSESALVGRSVADVIDEFRRDGHPFAYSTNLLREDLIVEAEPLPGTAIEIARQILTPHGLTIRTDSGVHLVVRLPVESSIAPKEPVSREAPAPRAGDIENVVVSASRYAVSRDVASSKFSIDQRTIQNLPDLGEDPIRVTQRLPGAAASGASAIAHFRGGETGEVGIMLNGHWLFDPFHIRDYQNIFSAIDARAIEGVEVYTGGFPVRFGDRMSGLVLMDSINIDKMRRNEIGLSVFNTSLLTAGRADKKSWLFSARRGNLDLVIDPKFGRPSYFDVFGEFAYDFTPSTRLSVNALYADDAVDLVLETEPTERDQVSSKTRNAQLWLRLDSAWSDTLSSTTVLSVLDYKNRRAGISNDIEKMVSTVSDDRAVKQYGFRQGWIWSPNDRHWTQWGISATNSDAQFDYAGRAAYFGLQALFENKPASVSRSIFASPRGGSYAVYVSDRWKFSDKSIVEWGLRWDDQTYTDVSSDAQLSPRFSYLRRLGEKTEVRISLGRYFQSQPIQSLQVEDGISNFWPAQRADHLIIGAHHLFKNDTSLRVEVFYKDIGRVRPRFENLFDPLGLMPELQQDRIRLDPQSARARGIELSLDRSSGSINWWGSYTWSRVTDDIAGHDIPRNWNQQHSVQAGLDWKGERWSFAAATSLHSGWPTTELVLNESGLVAPGPRNAAHHNAYASLDVRLSRKFDVPRGELTAFVEITNLLDRRNDCCLDWDIAENAAGESVLERGVDHWMPLLPAIGVLWEF